MTPDNSRLMPMGEGSSWLLLGKGEGEKIGDILAVDFGDKIISTEKFSASENILSQSEKLIPADSACQKKKRLLLPGFRMNKIESELWKNAGWQIDDYLPYCGIHSTAAAFGIARALREKQSSLFVHYNCHASGKQVIVVGSTK
jgi:hypothetical protein